MASLVPPEIHIYLRMTPEEWDAYVRDRGSFERVEVRRTGGRQPVVFFATRRKALAGSNATEKNKEN